MNLPHITIVIPSLNQGRFLEQALKSIFDQEVPVELFINDGGSKDSTLKVISKYESRIAGWRSYPDKGQSSAINEGISKGNAPFVTWLNSDDLLLKNGLAHLLKAFDNCPQIPAVYGRAFDYFEKSATQKPAWVEPFDEGRMAVRCIISQPATLIRRSVWETIGGLDENLHMAMDYDLWWKIHKKFGPLKFITPFIAINRIHSGTKTKSMRNLHYSEAIATVRKHYGRVPIKWWLYQPYSVWFKSLLR